MSSPVSPRASTHHSHRTSHGSPNTSLSVSQHSQPPPTPTHHRANSSGGTTTGPSLLSTLMSPETDTTSLVPGKILNSTKLTQ